MSYNTPEKQDEETNFIGETRFYDNDGNIIESLNQEEKILVINFPGSGMTFKNKDENKVKEGAKNTCSATKSLLPQNKQSLNQAFVCTAVYENKADKAIKEYNEENNNTHSAEIFKQVLEPMIVEGDYDKTLSNLNRVIFRGHCFGTMVIAEMEKLLEAKLEEKKFNKAQCQELLSAPQALISSPALQLDKYPKYFQTTAIVNNSDRTITGKEYCGNKLKQELRGISGFKDEDLVSFNAQDIFDKEALPENIPDIKIFEKKDKNLHLYICNRASLLREYEQIKESINKRIGLDCNDESYRKKFIKQLKKHIGGHEYFFLPDELKDKFSSAFKESFNKSQTRMRIREARKKLRNLNPKTNQLAQHKENQPRTINDMGKTGNSSTGEISNSHQQTAQKQVELTKLKILDKQLSNEK